MAELVEGSFSASRVAVAVANSRLLDLVEANACVLECVGAGLARHVGIVPVLRSADRKFKLRFPWVR